MKILSTRAILSIGGGEAKAFLQGLVTQDVTHARPQFAALLSPQGKILYDFMLHPTAVGFLVDCAATAAPALLKRLAMYKLRAKVTLSEEPALAVALGEGDDFVADPRHPELPSRAVVERREGIFADDEYDALRLALGVPEFGKDFASEEVFLLDVNYDALRAVSYAKGCFVGQEVTSRMKRKGEIRKRTLIAQFDGAPPPKGATIEAGDLAIGEILSGAEGIALALVRVDRLKEATDDGVHLTVSGRKLRLAVPEYLK
jgi:hypothetical protein